MKRTLSMQRVCSSCETGRIPNGIGRSGPVSTACTPSSCFAAVISIETMRACGSVLRSSLQYSILGNARSSANFVAPVTFATASTFRSAFPMMRWADGRMGGWADLPAIERFCFGFGFFAAHARRRQLHRLIDLDVAGAAAKVSRERVFDFVARGFGIGLEECFSGEQKRGRAIAALRGAEIGEGLLEGVELAALCHRFDRPDRMALAGKSQHQAREHRRSIQQHRAGA